MSSFQRHQARTPQAAHAAAVQLAEHTSSPPTPSTPSDRGSLKTKSEPVSSTGEIDRSDVPAARSTELHPAAQAARFVTTATRFGVPASVVHFGQRAGRGPGPQPPNMELWARDGAQIRHYLRPGDVTALESHAQIEREAAAQEPYPNVLWPSIEEEQPQPKPRQAWWTRWWSEGLQSSERSTATPAAAPPPPPVITQEMLDAVSSDSFSIRETTSTGSLGSLGSGRSEGGTPWGTLMRGARLDTESNRERFRRGAARSWYDGSASSQQQHEMEQRRLQRWMRDERAESEESSRAGRSQNERAVSEERSRVGGSQDEPVEARPPLVSRALGSLLVAWAIVLIALAMLHRTNPCLLVDPGVNGCVGGIAVGQVSFFWALPPELS